MKLGISLRAFLISFLFCSFVFAFCDDGTILHRAAMLNDKQLLEQSISNFDIDLDAQDIRGMTALHMAVFWNHVECALLLLEFGSDVAIKDIKNQTAIEIAREMKHLYLCDILLKYETKEEAAD